MTALLQLFAWICGIGSVVCFILVLVEMFHRGYVGLAVTCIVLSVCCGIGGLVGFITGWVKAWEWQIERLMIWWTTFVVAGVVASMLSGAFRFLGSAFRGAF